MSTTTPAPPRLLNTVSPAPKHHDGLQSLLDRLVQDTGTSYGVVFGTHGLHLFRSGNLDQVGAERVTAILTNVLLLSRGAGNLTERGEAETIVVRYRFGALVLAPLGTAFALGLFIDGSDEGLVVLRDANVPAVVLVHETSDRGVDTDVVRAWLGLSADTPLVVGDLYEHGAREAVMDLCSALLDGGRR